MLLGEYLRRHRQAKGLTIDEAAQATDISRPYLSQIERGTKRAPSEKILHKLAITLDIPFATLTALANQESVSTEYLKEALDYSELYQMVISLQTFLTQVTKDENLDLINQYNFLMKINKTLDEIKVRLTEISMKRAPRSLPPEIEGIVADLLILDDKGRLFVKELALVYQRLFLKATGTA